MIGRRELLCGAMATAAIPTAAAAITVPEINLRKFPFIVHIRSTIRHGSISAATHHEVTARFDDWFENDLDLRYATINMGNGWHITRARKSQGWEFIR